jgi:hypothetical protein
MGAGSQHRIEAQTGWGINNFVCTTRCYRILLIKADNQARTVNCWGRSQPLRLVVGRRAHREELERFEACDARWPFADDYATWKSVVGADGYGRSWVRRGAQQIMVRAEGFADRHGGQVAATRAQHR